MNKKLAYGDRPAGVYPPLHVGWVISGNRTKASSRLQGILIHEWLVRSGIRSEIIATDFNRIDSPNSPELMATAIRLRRSRATHAVFEAPEWPMVRLAQLWRSWGKCAVAVRCDKIPGAYDENFDLTILPTDGLRAALGITRAAIIDDVVEVPSERFKQDYRSGEKIKVVWVGHPSYEQYITQLVSRLRFHPQINDFYTFELISTGAFATKQWSEKNVVSDILSCDIALLPIPQGEWYQDKSSNRLAMMFSLAMPVIASRISSYEALARDNMNSLLVQTEEDIVRRLLDLRMPEERRRIGSEGRRSLGDQFHIESIGPQWLSAILSARHNGISSRNWRMRLLNLLVCGVAAANFR